MRSNSAGRAGRSRSSGSRSRCRTSRAPVAPEVRVHAHVAQVGPLEERAQRHRPRGVVEVADDHDVLLAAGAQAGVDRRGAGRLAAPGRVRLGLRPVPLGLEVVDEHGERAAAGQRDDVLRAVAAEDESAARVPVVDVGAHGPDLVRSPGEQPDVDPAVVVAVDDHDVRVERAPGAGDARVGEALERDAALGLDDREDVRADVGHDARRVHHRELVDPVLTRSTQPTQSPRPVATTSVRAVPAACDPVRRTSRPAPGAAARARRRRRAAGRASPGAPGSRRGRRGRTAPRRSGR